ncbi:29797_t:CDS:2, partial [Racocetra persica]
MLVKNRDLLRYTFTASDLTIQQRVGRTGRDCDGTAFVYRILDKEMENHFYTINFNLHGPLEISTFLKMVGGESDNPKPHQDRKPENSFIVPDYSCRMSGHMVEQLKKGSKSMDLRVADPSERFVHWRVNDVITIINRENPKDFIQARIKQIFEYGTSKQPTPHMNLPDTISMFESFPGYSKKCKQYGSLVFALEIISIEETIQSAPVLKKEAEKIVLPIKNEKMKSVELPKQDVSATKETVPAKQIKWMPSGK